jgi:hypothetical protein
MASSERGGAVWDREVKRKTRSSRTYAARQQPPPDFLADIVRWGYQHRTVRCPLEGPDECEGK